MAGAGLDTTSLDDEAFNTEAAQDRCILRLIASCCNGESYYYYYYLIPSFPICLIYILKKMKKLNDPNCTCGDIR